MEGLGAEGEITPVTELDAVEGRGKKLRRHKRGEELVVLGSGSLAEEHSLGGYFFRRIHT